MSSPVVLEHRAETIRLPHRRNVPNFGDNIRVVVEEDNSSKGAAKVTISRVDDHQHEMAVLEITKEGESLPSEIVAELLKIGEGDKNAVCYTNDTLFKVEDLVKRRGLSLSIRMPGMTDQVLSLDDLPFDDPSSGLHEPSEMRDGLTGLRTRILLHSKSGRERLEQDISGPKVLYCFDLKHMGVANKAGLGELVDTFLKEIPKIAEQTLASLKYEVIRLGGDEFSIIIQDTEKTTQAMQAFQKALNTKRLELFAIEKLREVDNKARVRDETKKILSEYTEHCGGKTDKGFLQGFETWLRKQLNNSKIKGGIGELTLALAKRRVRADKTEHKESCLLACSWGAVKLGDDLSQIDLALGKADQGIQRSKGSASSKLPLPSSLEKAIKTIKVREATVAVSEQVEIAETQYSQHYREISLLDYLLRHTQAEHRSRVEVNALRGKLALFAATDPAVDNTVLRLGPIMDDLIAHYMFLNKRTSVHVLSLNISEFGIINNRFGADQGDQMYGCLAVLARKYFGTDVMIRKDGGSLYIFSRRPFDLAKVNVIREEYDPKLHFGAREEKAYGEYLIKIALSNFISGINVEPKRRDKYHVIEAQVWLLEVEAKDKIGPLFKRLALMPSEKL